MEKKLTVLAKIAHVLNSEGITWALGASGMLYLNGITDVFHDLDVMVSEDCIEKAREVLSALGPYQSRKPNPQYRTRHFLEYVIDGVDVDVMAGFVIVRDGSAYEAPFDSSHIEKYVTIHGEPIPLQRLSDWHRYYTLMGRPGKARMCGPLNQ